MIRALAALLILCSSFAARAAEEAAPADEGTSQYNVHVEEKESRLIFGFYTGFSQFAKEGKTLFGADVDGIADYALWNRFAVQLSLNQSLDTANGLTVLYTGLRVGGAYSFLGNFIHRQSSISVNGQQSLSVTEPDEPIFVVDGAIDQVFFNGESSVIPATGASVGARYDRKFWKVRGSAMIRYGALVISAEPVSMITAGLGVLVRF